jgi:hypothetical protein
MTRDLTRAQFAKLLDANDFDLPVFGYVKDRTSNVERYAPNGGDRRRDQLAYLLAERQKRESRT